jgi:hypothetical protein
MWSASACGAAPLPPSPPSMVRKSGAACRPASGDRGREFGHEVLAADCRLDANRLAGQRAHLLDSVEQVVDAGNVPVTVRAQRILAFGNAADAGDLGRHLVAGQDAALARLRPLRELDLESPYRFVRGQFAQAFCGQLPAHVAHPVFRGADLKDDVAAALEMIRRQPALTGIEPAAGGCRAMRQGAYGGHGDGAETHGADVYH